MVQNVLVAIIVGVAFVLVVRRLVRQYSGRGGCHCDGCTGCSAQGSEHTKTKCPTKGTSKF